MALQFFLISLMKGHSEQRPNPTSMRFKFQYSELRIFLSQSWLWPFIPVFSFPSLASLSKIKWKTIELLSIIKFRFNLQFVAWKKKKRTQPRRMKKNQYIYFSSPTRPSSSWVICLLIPPNFFFFSSIHFQLLFSHIVFFMHTLVIYNFSGT